jgi:tetratricopeptide (TPR) repeat protein
MRRFGAVVAAVCLITGTAAGDVRPISDAERAAVAFAAEYLAGGAAALADDLAAGSPIRKLPPAAIPVEIETRLGPPAGTEWRMVTVVDALKDKAAGFEVTYPSGLDDTVFFDLVKEGEAWKINDLRITAMPSARKPLFPPLKSDPVKETPAEDKGPNRLAAWAGAGAILFAATALVLMRSRGGLARLAYLFAIALVGAGAALLYTRLDDVAVKKEEPKSAVSVGGGARLGDLIALRRALAAGGQEVGAALANAPRAGLPGDVAKLWKAQWDLTQNRLQEVSRALDSFPSPSDVPLAEILRARMALVENKPERAVVAYQNAINAGPGRDALWREMSIAMAAGGFEDLAKKNLTRLMDIGTRDPGTYYLKAMLSKTTEELETELKRAWNLQPASRGQLVQWGVLWSIVRKRNPFVNLSDPHEPRFASTATGSRAITLPPGAKGRVSGDFFHVAINDAEISVAGGAALAPADAPFVGADEWDRLVEAKALAEVPSMLVSPPPAGSYMQPALRLRSVRAAEALAERNRWPEVLTLTAAISPKSEFVPTSLFFLRAEALQRAGRTSESRQLLLELAGSQALARRRDADSYEELAEMLASLDEYQIAIKVIERAKSIRPLPYHDTRIAQLLMDQKLAGQYQTHTTPHFQIQYPTELPSGLASKLGVVLEGELKRLQSWVPTPSFQPVVVNVVWWQEFVSIYTGTEDILGFYNGKITLPLAGIMDFPPEIVAIVTHELCHAMIAQATNDQAPRWFHEGLAQRVSMVEYHANPFNMYDDDKLFAISVLDPMFQSSVDPDMIGAAYIMSQALIRFVEERYGREGIHKLLQSYNSGGAPDDALVALAGKDLGQINSEFRAWGKAESRVFENRIAVRYDAMPDDSMNLPRIDGSEPPPKRQKMGGGTFYPQRP